MVLLGLLFVFAFGISGVPAPHEHEHAASKFCYRCHDTSDPTSCTHLEKCHPDTLCGAQVKLEHGNLQYNLGCYHEHDCGADPVLVGKRALHHNVKCQECCHGDSCNKGLCSSYMTSSATTTSASTGGTVSQPTDTCQDHEEDGITCAQLVALNLCSDTHDASSLIAKQKCPKTCGLCTPATNVCRDHEEDGVTCGQLVALNLCHDTHDASRLVALQKCPMSCGFCTPGGGAATAATGGPIVTAQTTGGANVVVTGATTSSPIIIATDTQTGQTGNPTVIATSPKPTEVPILAPACVDDEADGFQCSSFDQFDFCRDKSSFAYPLAKRCPKHCGDCGGATGSGVITAGMTTTTDANTNMAGNTDVTSTDSSNSGFTIV